MMGSSDRSRVRLGPPDVSVTNSRPIRVTTRRAVWDESHDNSIKGCCASARQLNFKAEDDGPSPDRGGLMEVTALVTHGSGDNPQRLDIRRCDLRDRFVKL